jgi:hypothetical protein
MVVELLQLLVDFGLLVVEVPQDHHMIMQLEQVVLVVLDLVFGRVVIEIFPLLL